MRAGKTLAEALAHLEAFLAQQFLLVEKFDPDQPRDEQGRWTSGGGGPTGFVSPNVSNLQFNQAVAALDSKEQQRLNEASGDIDKRLGITATNRPVIGAWADGAENSIMVEARGANTPQMRAAMAMKGYLADQKSVLIFSPDEQHRDSFLAHFDMPGKIEDIHNQLLQGQVPYHTLEPKGRGARVYVYGSDQDTVHAIEKVAERSKTSVRYSWGQGEFLGTAKESGSDREQRDDARSIYEKTIREIANSGALGGRDVGKIWGEVRDRWKSVQKTLADLKALLMQQCILVEKFNPDQPRVPAGSPEGGQFGEGTGGGKPAAALLEKPTETADQVIAKVPGAKERVAKVREDLAKAVPTDAPAQKGGFMRPDGSWTPERTAIHDKIIRETLTPDKIAAATPGPGEKPTLHILGGRAGSGKSWFTQQGGTVDPSKAIVLNNDDFKAALPGYKGWNAATVHEESSHVGARAELFARDKKLNVIIDGTMRTPGSLIKRVEEYKKAGYRIEGHYMYVSPQEAAQRALGRFMRRPNGRYVPPEYVLSSVTNEKSFDSARNRMDKWEIYDNSGKEPKLYARSKG